MRAMSNSILAIGALAALVLGSGIETVRAQAEQHLFVTTAEGQVYGLVQAGIAAFKGMPYAAPPIGDERWRPPQPAAPDTTQPPTPPRARATAQSRIAALTNAHQCANQTRVG